MPGKYEAGRSYNTEKGGVVGPIRVASDGLCYCWNGPEKRGEWYSDGSCVDQRIEAFYGRLTTEATPTVEGEGGGDGV